MPRRRNMKKTTLRYIKIKLLKPVIKRKCSIDSERHNMYREKKECLLLVRNYTSQKTMK